MADKATKDGDRRARNPRGSGDRLREEIVEAGIRLVDETGDSAALTLRGVARAAGIAAPSIYQHFPSPRRRHGRRVAAGSPNCTGRSRHGRRRGLGGGKGEGGRHGWGKAPGGGWGRLWARLGRRAT